MNCIVSAGWQHVLTVDISKIFVNMEIAIKLFSKGSYIERDHNKQAVCDLGYCESWNRTPVPTKACVCRGYFDIKERGNFILIILIIHLSAADETVL